MELSTRNLDQLVTEQAMVAQAEAGPQQALDFSVGTVLRALAQGFGAVGLWIQAMALHLLAFSRAATSRGEDLDSWMADFGIVRVEAEPARGEVTFGRFTPALPAFVPVGAEVKSADGSRTYAVVADPALPAFDPDLNGYRVPAGAAGVTAPVVALADGPGGNALPGTVTLLASSIPGVDTVTNATALSGGADAESDDALRARFVAYIGSLSLGVEAAVDRAVAEVQAGLTWSFLENIAADGTLRAAHFTVVVDDGSGSPSADLISRVSAAVGRVRALGVSYSVIGPDVTRVNITLSITIEPGASRPIVIGAVGDAIEAYVASLELGEGLSYTRISQVAYQASALVTNVTNVLVNGGTSDIPGAPRRAIRAGTIAVA